MHLKKKKKQLKKKRIKKESVIPWWIWEKPEIFVWRRIEGKKDVTTSWREKVNCLDLIFHEGRKREDLKSMKEVEYVQTHGNDHNWIQETKMKNKTINKNQCKWYLGHPLRYQVVFMFCVVHFHSKVHVKGCSFQWKSHTSTLYE